MTSKSTQVGSLTVEAQNLREELKPSRPYDWWRRFTPLWLDVVLNDDGSVTFTPNGKHANGLTSVPGRLAYKSMIGWAERCPAFVGDVTGTAK